MYSPLRDDPAPEVVHERNHRRDQRPSPAPDRRHPGAAPAMGAATFPVFAYLVLHPAGPILIDSGVGIGNSFIDELYSPVHHDLDEAWTDMA